MSYQRDVVVEAEMEAHRLLYGRYGGMDVSFHQAADQIIALAEQIKAQRATAAMQMRQREAL